MKTAIEILIDWIINNPKVSHYEALIKANELFDIEKKQLKTAYSEGYEAGKSDYEHNSR